MGKIQLDAIVAKYRGLIISFSILLLSILISILLFSLIPLINKNTPVNEEYREEYSSGEAYSPPAATLLDFELEDFNNQFTDPGIYYKRPVLEKWDKAQVKKFFIPVENVLLDLIGRENDKVMQGIFSGLD